MVSANRRFLAAASLLITLPFVSCGAFDNDDDRDDRDTGYLTVTWSLAGATDPAACATGGATGCEVTFFDDDGFFLGELEVPCSRFSASIELLEGDYALAVRLVNNDDDSVGETVKLQHVEVKPDSEVMASLQFPDL